MPTPRSEQLRLDQESRRIDPPDPYCERRSIQMLLRVLVPAMALALVFAIVVWLLLPGLWGLFGALSFVVGWIVSYRTFFMWRWNYISCDPDDGVLRIEENKHPNSFFGLIFNLTGSNDDQYPLNDVNLKTPLRTWFDTYVFHCATLVVGKRELRDVKGVELLLEIQQYRESLEHRTVDLIEDGRDVSMAMLEALEQTNELLAEIRDMMRGGTPHPAFFRQPSPLSPTYQLPVVRYYPGHTP